MQQRTPQILRSETYSFERVSLISTMLRKNPLIDKWQYITPPNRLQTELGSSCPEGFNMRKDSQHKADIPDYEALSTKDREQPLAIEPGRSATSSSRTILPLRSQHPRAEGGGMPHPLDDPFLRRRSRARHATGTDDAQANRAVRGLLSPEES